jgi:hypothetical protein
MTKVKDCWKIVEKKKGKIKTLFHGIDKSKVLSKKIWLKADKKLVADGSKGTKYLSGFHIFLNRKIGKEYLARFSGNDLILIKCKAQGIRKKRHSPHNVYLADYLYLL